MRILCLYFNQPQNTQGLAEVFYRATPQIMLGGRQALFMELSRCRGLYSESKFLLRTHLTLKKLGIRASVAVGDYVCSSLAQAFYQVKNVDHLPIDSLKFFFDPLFKEREGAKQVFNMIDTLMSLGVNSLGELKQIPLREISSRFGAMGVHVYQRVLGVADVPWVNFTPSEVVKERFEFDLENPADNLEPVFFRLRAMLEMMVLRLRGVGLRPRAFDVVFKQEFAPTKEEVFYRVSVILQLPYVADKVIFQITREKIEASVRAKPLASRLTEFEVTVTESVPYHMIQKDIFDPKREENNESFFQLVSRMATKLGKGTVFFAKLRESYLPEKNWKRLDEVKDSLLVSQDHLPERPLRLFKNPIRVGFIEDRIVSASEDFYDEVESMQNREVVLADWWESPLERVYYKVLTKSGTNLWVYRTREGHFLHGVFD